jgi:hypothetical protein
LPGDASDIFHSTAESALTSVRIASTCTVAVVPMMFALIRIVLSMVLVRSDEGPARWVKMALAIVAWSIRTSTPVALVVTKSLAATTSIAGSGGPVV